MKTVTERIKKYLYENKIKKSLLADYLGKSRQGLNQALNQNDIKMDLYLQIVNFLNVEPGYFLYNKENENKDIDNLSLVNESKKNYDSKRLLKSEMNQDYNNLNTVVKSLEMIEKQLLVKDKQIDKLIEKIK